MAKTPTIEIASGPIDCACVIHGTAYDWQYVDRLYSMLTRNISTGIRFHVYTEATRPVPPHMIRHDLTDWNISGPKRSWWYKMQLFDTNKHAGSLLYFDLDVVITQNIDWIWQLPLNYFWGVRDFKYLWRNNSQRLNSSVMWWDTRRFAHIYEDFKKQPITKFIQKYQGDQDYITEAITQDRRRFFDSNRIASWRWQALDGGYDFRTRSYKTPNTGTFLSPATSVLVFHGNPKPAQIQDPVIAQHWR